MRNPEPSSPIDPSRQTAVGVALFAALFIGAATLHIYGVFHHQIGWASLVIAPVLIVTLSWLAAGLFIVAHDAMHGSLAPGRPRINAAIGAVILLLYAGFDWRKMKAAHMRHHAEPGTARDPDFNAADPTGVWSWYALFMKRYFGWPQFLFVSAVVALYMVAFGASYANVVLFYGAPAILSSFQLFYFGTFLPHRHGGRPFADQHNARSNEFGWLASLLTCFHFGYHHEHHLAPGAPWWRLPSVRRSLSETPS